MSDWKALSVRCRAGRGAKPDNERKPPGWRGRERHESEPASGFVGSRHRMARRNTERPAPATSTWTNCNARPLADDSWRIEEFHRGLRQVTLIERCKPVP